jgi:hypothetical protein
MKMFKFTKIMTVVTITLAMAATTFATDMAGTYTIDAAWGLGYTSDARLGQGTPAIINIVAGGTWNTDGEMRYGEENDATINVAVGGTLNAEVEMLWNDQNQNSPEELRLNVYGTAFVEQLKMYGHAGDDETVVGNGTDAATLTIVEGLLGKHGDAHITINAGSTMIITAGTFKIDSDNIGSDSYIDLNGGTLKIDSLYLLQGTETAHRIRANGDPSATVASGGVVVTAGTGPDAGYTIYTAAASGTPGTVFIIK